MTATLRKLTFVCAFFLFALCVMAKPIRVLVWDECQPAQKKAYTNFLGNAIADYLNKQPGIQAKSVALDDPEQGLSKANLDNTDVLIWWGHVRHHDVKQEHVDDVVQRIKDGKLRLIALHSAHWSKIFIKAMAERAIEDGWKKVPAGEKANTTLETIPADLGGLAPKQGRMTPWSEFKKGADGKDILTVKLPSCVFPAVHDEGLTGHLTTTFPKHQIARGIPAKFDVPQTEVYAGPFHVPVPDAIIFREKWDTGESFPSGCVWSLGKGKIFYFRPGHEAYPIYTQPIPLKIVENAVRWLPY